MPCLLRVLTLIPRPLPFPSRADLSFIRFELGGNGAFLFLWRERIANISVMKMIHPSMVEASWTSKMAEGERETGMTDIPRHDLLRHRCPSNSIRGTRFCIPSAIDRSWTVLVDHGWNRGRSWNYYYPSTRSSLLLRELYTPRSLLAIR